MNTSDSAAQSPMGRTVVRTLSKDVVVCVACHKPYEVPDEPIYLPVQAGAALHDPIEGFMPDVDGTFVRDGDQVTFTVTDATASSDTEDAPLDHLDGELGAISAKNGRLSELTVLYWAWRHVDAKAVGLCHYRRYFRGTGPDHVLTESDARELLKRSPVVVAKHRNYVIETLGSHYAHTMDPKHLDLLMEAVSPSGAEYERALIHHLGSRTGHMFNMFIMERPLLDEYCSWLFPIIGRFEQAMDFRGLTPFEKRAPGRVSELLLDPWLSVKGLRAVECPVENLEPVDWVAKGSAFLKAKFFGKKYEESF